MRIVSVGQVVFALTMIGLGIAGLVTGDFSYVWQPVPRDFAGREALAYLCALVSLGCGAGFLWRRAAPMASRVLVVAFLVWFFLLRVPQMLMAFNVNTWFSAGETSVMLAGAWALYVRFAGDADQARVGFATGGSGLRIARAFYGTPMIPFGIAHFLYIPRTASLVPGWLPWHVAWAYFFGVTFIAAGIGLLINVLSRLAATLSTLQMGLFTILVWVPIILAGSTKPMDWQEFIVSIALTAAGWVVAESYQGVGWLAVRKR